MCLFPRRIGQSPLSFATYWDQIKHEVSSCNLRCLNKSSIQIKLTYASLINAIISGTLVSSLIFYKVIFFLILNIASFRKRYRPCISIFYKHKKQYFYRFNTVLQKAKMDRQGWTRILATILPCMNLDWNI